MFNKERMDALRLHLMTGVSYMIPVIVVGGMFFAVAQIISGGDPVEGTFAYFLLTVGEIGLRMIVPVIAAYIAFSMSDKPGIAPGFVVGMLAEQMGTGFLGGLIAGLLVGYVVSHLKRLIMIFPSMAMPLSATVIPVVTTLTVGALMYYVIGGPIEAFIIWLTNILDALQGTNAILMAVVLGAMMAFDMGGPVNKTALAFALALFVEGSYIPGTATFIAIGVPPLGMVLACYMMPRKYTLMEREATKSSLVMGLMTLTEGAIPYAVSDPLRVIPAIMIGSALSSALAVALGVVNTSLMAGFFALPFVGGLGGAVLYLLAFLAGIVVTALVANLLKKEVIEEEAGEPWEAA